MIKHTAASAVLIGLLVASLVYCISPGELETVWSIACNSVSMRANQLLSETPNRGTMAIDARNATARSAALPGLGRNITPDPFRPFSRRRPAGANGFLVWLKGPQAVAVWLSLVALALGARYAARRRFNFATQQRMALTLSKAVREM